MTDHVGPAIARERLRTRLCELREKSEMPAGRVAKAMSWSLSKLNRIETGDVTIQPVEVQVLLGLYGVTDPDEITRLKELSAISRERKWWSKHGLSQEFKTFVAYEDEASHLYGYHPLRVPGQLQTAEYAREMISQIVCKSPDDPDVDDRLEVRLRRQESLHARLDGDAPPHLNLALDEAILRRPVGGSAVMRGQLDHLLSLTERPTVDLVVIPLSVGAQPGLGGTFELLKFAGENDLDVLFFESTALDRIVTNRRITKHFHEVMGRLREKGLTGQDAIAEIRRIRNSMSS